MRCLKTAFTLFLCLVAWASATHVAVLETVAEENAKDSVSLTDRRYLTNVLREQAVQQLPVEQNYVIMTRDNISVMLPPGMVLEDCEGSCLAETGRNIAADFICQARVGKFGGMLTLSAELYETAGNKLIASFNGRGANVNELLELIEQKSPDFFRRVRDLAVSATAAENEARMDNAGTVDSTSIGTEKPVAEEVDSVAAEPEVVKPEETKMEKSRAEKAYDELDGKQGAGVGESIPANVENAKGGNAVHWTVLGVSAAVGVTGAVLAVVGNNQAKDAADKGFDSQSGYEDNRKKAENGQTLRGVGIGLAIAGAVGIGISFAF